MGWMGSIWGGEFLVGDVRGFQRAAHLAVSAAARGRRPPSDSPIAWRWPTCAPCWAMLALLAGVARAVRSRRAAHRGADDGAPGQHAAHVVRPGGCSMPWRRLLGVCSEASYEAQAAIALEMAAMAGGRRGCPTQSLRRRGLSLRLVAASGVQSWGVVQP